MEVEINLLPFIVESMGDNEYIYEDIDRIYVKNRYAFYRAAKEHPLYNHQIIKEGSLIQEEYRKKILGILVEAQNNKDIIVEIENLIKKGYRYTYIYVRNHPKIYLNEYTKFFIKKHKNQKELYTKLEQNIPILILLAINNSNEIIEDDFFYNYTSLLNIRWMHYNDTENTRISLEKASCDDKKMIKELKKNIYNKYGKIRNFNDLIAKESENTHIFLCSLLFDYEKLSSISILENISFTDKDIDEILYLYIVGKKDLEDTEAALEFLITHMYIKYLIKAYKSVKEMYFKNNKETMFIELEALELENKKLNKKIIVKEKNEEELIRKLEALEKENIRLKNELQKEREYKSELNGLREFIFSLDEEIEYKGTDEIDYELLKDYKSIMIGGHEKWQQKMKEYLPNFIFIHSDMLNFDTSIFNNVDIIFIFINYLSHRMYYKVMESIKGKDIKVVYINRQNHKEVLKIIQDESMRRLNNS